MKSHCHKAQNVHGDRLHRSSGFIWDNPSRIRIIDYVARELERLSKQAVAPHSFQRIASGLSYSVIWSALERVRRSQAMKGCQRLVQFLTFVVEATLKGKADHLKETTIGVFVFGRPPDYDPKVDTIVRSQAWRLRGKLRQYYASEGLHDPVVIDVPVGGYVPAFHLRPQETHREHDPDL